MAKNGCRIIVDFQSLADIISGTEIEKAASLLVDFNATSFRISKMQVLLQQKGVTNGNGRRKKKKRSQK